MPTDNSTPAQQVKHCEGCGRTLPLEQFWRRPERPLGVVSRCKECKYKEHRTWMENNWKPSEHGRINARNDAGQGVKWCGGCKQKLPIEMFWKSRTTWDGLQSHCRKCQHSVKRKWDLEHEEQRRKYGRDSYHRNPFWPGRSQGVSREQSVALKEKQTSACAICGDRPGSPNLHLDHCHATGAVRSFLCVNCNRGIGCATESPEIIYEGIKYLRAEYEFQEDLRAALYPLIPVEPCPASFKICPRCLRPLPLESFYRRPDKSSGMASHCKLCHRISRATARGTGFRNRRIYTAADYIRQELLQSGKCAICLQIKPLEIDHDKTTGVFRGLLCGNCNTMIGSFRHSETIMRSAALYVTVPSH